MEEVAVVVVLRSVSIKLCMLLKENLKHCCWQSAVLHLIGTWPRVQGPTE